LGETVQCTLCIALLSGLPGGAIVLDALLEPQVDMNPRSNKLKI